MARKLDRIEAKRLYCEEKKEVKEISRLLSVPEGTIYAWKSADAERGNDWDKMREEIQLTSFSATKDMLRMVTARLSAMADELTKAGPDGAKINPSEVYAIRQLLKSLKELQKDVDHYGNILLAMQEFTDFMGDRAPELLLTMEPYLLEFGNTISKKYGRRRSG
jgi:transposase-like protein